jgi:hypothetical protein
VEEKLLNIKYYICPKCQNNNSTKHKSFRCNKCNSSLSFCEKCNKIFIKNKKGLKICICDDCLIDKEIIIKEFKENLLSIKKISYKYPELPISYIKKIFKQLNINDNFVFCKICEKQGKIIKRKRIWSHLNKIHNINVFEYLKQFPDEKIQIKEIMDIHKQKINKTMLEKYGQKKEIKQYNFNKDIDLLINTFENLIFINANIEKNKKFFVKTNNIRNPEFVVIYNNDYLQNIKKLSVQQAYFNVSNDFIKQSIKITKVLEFKNFQWHCNRCGDLDKKMYELEIINDYKNANLECLIVWDEDLLNNKQETLIKIEKFIKY